MKSLFLTLAVPAGLLSQTIAITSPTASQQIGGTSFVFRATVASAPGTCSVEYDVNGGLAGYAYSAPWSLIWNTFYVSNNAYNSVVAIARDCVNNVIATSAAVTFAVANPLPEPVSQLTLAVTPPAGTTWTGTVTFTLALTGSNASTNCQNNIAGHICSAFLFIDGQQKNIVNLYGTGTFTTNLDTTQFDNGGRDVYWRLDDYSRPLGSGVSWVNAGEWHKQITFSNGATAEYLALSTEDAYICTTAQTNCPTSVPITGKVVKTDGTSSTATFSSVAVNSANGCAPLGGSGACSWPIASGVVSLAACSSCTSETITQGGNGPGTVQLIFTESGGMTRTMYVHVNTVNQVWHFGSDRDSHATCTSKSDCMWFASTFFSQNNINDSNYPAAYNYQQDHVNAGLNTIEVGIGASPGSGQSEGSWDSQQTNTVSTVTGQLAPYGLFAHVIADGMSLIPGSYAALRGAGSGYATPVFQYTAQQWVASGIMLGSTLADEINLQKLASCPLCGTGTPLTLANPVFTSGLVCVNSANCSVSLGTYNGVQLTAGDLINNSNVFIISGATTHSCLNSSGASAQMYSYTSGGSTSLAFTNPCGSGFTATSGTDPGLTIQNLSQWWTTPAQNGNPCGSSCTDYLQNNTIATEASQFSTGGGTSCNGASGRCFKMGWGTAFGYDQSSIQNWNGDSTIADIAVFYWNVNNDFLPGYNNQMNLPSAIGFPYRQKYGWLKGGRLAPILIEGAATASAYGQEGYNVSLASCSGSLCTFAAPHGIGTVIPWNTRLLIAGASSGNGNYYVVNCPTATTCNLAMQYPNFTFAGAVDGSRQITVHFPSGSTQAIYALDATSSGGGFGNFEVNGSDSTTNACNARGAAPVTFTTGSVPIGGYGTNSWWFLPRSVNLDSQCNKGSSGSYTNKLLQIPSLASTGGTATIYLNAGYTRGINYVGPGSSEVGPRFMAASHFYCILLPNCSGVRNYAETGYLDDPNSAFSKTVGFGDTGSGSISAGMHPRYLTYGQQNSWQAHTVAAQLAQKLAPLIFCQMGSAPDYGQYFESAVRLGCSAGSAQLVQSFADYRITRTIDLSGSWASGCNTGSGRSFILYSAGWQGINAITTLAAGSTSTSFTFDPDSAQFLAVVCAGNTAAEYSPPVIAARLADISGASKIAVRYSYTQFTLNVPQITRGVLTLTQDCSSGACTLPVDRQIGTVYYQLVYLDANGAVLATSDVQTL